MDSKQALIRDLARLFVKYDMEDWQFVMNALRQGGSELGLLQNAVEVLAAKRKRPRTPGAHQEIVKELLSEVEKKDAKKAAILRKLYELLSRREVAPRLADIRDFCVTAGIKASLPKRRDDAIIFLVRELAQVQDKRALENLWRQLPVRDRDLDDEYRGWFRMIYPDSN